MERVLRSSCLASVSSESWLVCWSSGWVSASSLGMRKAQTTKMIAAIATSAPTTTAMMTAGFCRIWEWWGLIDYCLGLGCFP